MDALNHKYLQNEKQNIVLNYEECKNQTAHTQPVLQVANGSFFFASKSPFPAQDLYLADQQAPKRYCIGDSYYPFASLLS